jgi:hypothetical protein
MASSSAPRGFSPTSGDRLAYLETRIGSTLNWSRFGVSASPETHRLMLESFSLEDEASKLAADLRRDG